MDSSPKKFDRKNELKQSIFPEEMSSDFKDFCDNKYYDILKKNERTISDIIKST